MRKEYETPKAEKVEFDYEEGVVASGTQCQSGTAKTNVNTSTEKACEDTPVSVWFGPSPSVG